MYERFFFLTENPFHVTPDTRFLYPGRCHKEAMDLLLFGILKRKGFILLTGEVGTGKTTICRRLLNKLSANKVATALVLNPLFSKEELLDTVLEDFGIEAGNASMKGRVDALNGFLIRKASTGGNAALIIDEAQNLSPDTLEMVRLLSNLETEKMKLLQIVLSGQPELKDKLRLSELRQLDQRIAVRCHIEPLDREDTGNYIHNRLSLAGGDGNVKFTAEAVSIIFILSGGVPRAINHICDRALTAAFVADTRTVDNGIMKMVKGDLAREDDRGYDKRGSAGRHKERGRYTGYLIGSGIAVVALLLYLLFALSPVWRTYLLTRDSTLERDAGGVTYKGLAGQEAGLARQGPPR